MKKTKVQELAALAGMEKLPVQELLSICFLQAEQAIAFRAAWVLEHIEATYSDRFLPFFPEFVRRLPEQHNLSCQRHFTKILMHFTSPKAREAYQAAWAAIPDREAVVEVVFEWLIDPKTPVAIRVNCLDILLNLREEFPWIRDELQAQIEFYLRDGSPAMQSRGRKILRQV